MHEKYQINSNESEMRIRNESLASESANSKDSVISKASAKKMQTGWQRTSRRIQRVSKFEQVGEFQTISGAPDLSSTLTNFRSRRQSQTAESNPSEQLLKEKKQAEYRLKMVEKIAAYREHKIRQEFQRIEEDIAHQEFEREKQMKKDYQRHLYFEQ